MSLQREAEISHSGRMYMLPCPVRPRTREAEKCTPVANFGVII